MIGQPVVEIVLSVPCGGCRRNTKEGVGVGGIIVEKVGMAGMMTSSRCWLRL